MKILKDKFFLSMMLVVMTGLTAGLLLRDLSYWWIPLLLAFVCAGFVLEEEVLEEDEAFYARNFPPNEWEGPDDWEDYKAYEANVDRMNNNAIINKDKSLSFEDDSCNSCGYVVCACKPMSSQSDDLPF